MEQWQFLIQKEGERTWHPLEKPRIEIMEGRYRVVARSNRVNTDVEVRVTHSSPLEVPPRRRIQKRRRRINSEGLTAVIPFTYLKSGIWELQCSGDLMSDLLGASWQYTVSLAVIPSQVEAKVVSKKLDRNLESQHKVDSTDTKANQTKSNIPDIKPSRYSSTSSKDIKTNDAGLISSISIEAANKISPVGKTGKISSTPGNTAKKNSLDRSTSDNKEKLRDSLKAAAEKKKATSKKPPTKSNQSSQKITNSARISPAKTVNASSSRKQPFKSNAISNKTVNTKSVQESLEKSKAKLNKTVSKKSVQTSSNKPKTSNKKDLSKQPVRQEVTAIVEQSSNPVRVKGDTAEQILQNLMELALPSSEPLLPDRNIEDNLKVPPPLPLLITLDKNSFVASWGSTITLQGEIAVKETTQQIKQIAKAEVQIELRSPQSSQLLQSFRLPNPNKSLPFAIATLINIPEECASKLILGEVKLYGIISNQGVVELLASQSFTITAEIKELLAITVANPKGELEKFAYSTAKLSERNAPQTLEESATLDLELFNLVKAVKPEEQSVAGVPLTKKSLPPRIDARKLRRKVATHSLKLPNVPGYQEKIDEYINYGHIEAVSSSAATGTSFPYLRKSKPINRSTVEVDANVYDTQQAAYRNVTDNQNITETSLPVDDTSVDNTSQAELIVDRPKEDNYLEFEESVTSRNSEFIAAENLNTSPLIRQWMLSQGYSVPEPIDVEYEDYDIEISQGISVQQTSQNANAQTNDNSQALHQEKAQIDTQAIASTYLSISTSSGWQVNQIAAPSNQTAQEIVVDDTDIFADNILTTENTQLNQPVNHPAENASTSALTISSRKIEELPTPELYIAKKELVSGKSLNVRIRLPQGNSHLAVKLWVEDCHTRQLLDGPHLLSNFTPNKNQDLEIVTKLNIPFGCLEIRLEAIAVNTSTLHESHKFTIQRTVIPPDLPNIQLDAMLGM